MNDGGKNFAIIITYAIIIGVATISLIPAYFDIKALLQYCRHLRYRRNIPDLKVGMTYGTTDFTESTEDCYEKMPSSQVKVAWV